MPEWGIGGRGLEGGRRRWTGNGWEIWPDGTDATSLGRITPTYAPPAIVITENGAAFPDTVAADGSVEDAERLVATWRATSRPRPTRSRQACRSSATSRGRCSTTSSGRSATATRFGIVHVDFATQQRTLKASGRWYCGPHPGRTRRPARPAVSIGMGNRQALAKPGAGSMAPETKPNRRSHRS